MAIDAFRRARSRHQRRGTITNDTSWTLAGSPYIVTNNLAVTNNVTLTIDPGVVVQFNNGFGMTIRGRLLAEGNPASRNWTSLLDLPPTSTNRVIHSTNATDGSASRFYRLVVHPQ
jgi:hypothetical protein